MTLTSLEDKYAIENAMPWAERDVPKTLYGQLSDTAAKFPNHSAISFQLFSGPQDPAFTLGWSDLKDQVTHAQ